MTFKCARINNPIIKNCTPTFAMKRSAKLLSTAAWGFSSYHKRELSLLWKPSRFNCDTSVRRL
jgi:hypothetical protein